MPRTTIIIALLTTPAAADLALLTHTQSVQVIAASDDASTLLGIDAELQTVLYRHGTWQRLSTPPDLWFDHANPVAVSADGRFRLLNDDTTGATLHTDTDTTNLSTPDLSWSAGAMNRYATVFAGSTRHPRGEPNNIVLLRGNHTTVLARAFADEVNTNATQLSHDGSAVLGHSQRTNPASPGSNFITQSWLWTDARGYTLIPTLDPALPQHTAVAMSADASVVIGNASQPTGGPTRAWIWRHDTLTEFTHPQAHTVSLTDLSSDASVLLGHAAGDTFNTPFLWSQSDGFVSIAALLAAQGLDLSTIASIQAADLSDDATRITGTLFDINGHHSAFVLTIPTPSTLAALTLLIPRRRRGSSLGGTDFQSALPASPPRPR